MPLRKLVEMWIPMDGNGALNEQIYRGLAGKIADGSLARGSRLPSTRTLAQQLSISRGTLQVAFDQLIAEGYLVARTGSGTFVADQLPEERMTAPKPVQKARAKPRGRGKLSGWAEHILAANLGYPFDHFAKQRPAPYEFIYGVHGEQLFPTDVWRKLIARRAGNASPRSLAYGPPEGLPELRSAIAKHVQRFRGVRCTAEQVLITGGIQQAMQLAARVVLDRGDSVLIEEPCYLGARFAFLAEGAELVPVPVDGDGFDLSRVDAKKAARCRLAYVTPSHQFPLGSVLSLSRRRHLLAWAESADAYIFEDDYDGEFRYEGRPIESMQSLDEGARVIYAGTFSKSMFSSLRLGYLVLPETLFEPFRAAKWLADWSSPTLLMETLLDFIEEGHFERHLRRCREHYAGRREALLDALERTMKGEVEVEGSKAGLHVVVWLNRVAPGELGDVIARAREYGAGVYDIAPYYLAPPDRAGLLLGYSWLGEKQLREGVRRLARAISKT